MVYALDRVIELEKNEYMKYTLPSSFSAKECFANAYGIIIADNTPLETVVLKASKWHAHYLRSLPLHHSQVEKELSEEYSIFEYHLCPTIDFQQEILSMGACVEVLSPQWLRESIGSTVKIMHEKYNI